MKDKVTVREVFQWIFVAVFILGLIGCIIYIGTKDLNSKEGALLSIILTIISVIATWIVANMFADSAHKSALSEVKEQHLNNLKTYALNAAEKVDNLSNELGKLSIYLQQEIEKDDDSLEEANLSKSERIESAIHIVNTLKSVNNTSLSDWKGVIGDELDEIREERLDRENELRDLVDRVEEVINTQNSHFQNLTNKSSREQSQQIDDIKKELSLVLNTVSGTVVKPVRKKSTRENVENNCPHCSVKLNYTQRSKSNSYKTLKCNNCDKRSLARWDHNKGFFLEKESFISESIKCPWCNESSSIELSNVPFTKNIAGCTECDQLIKATRSINGLTLSRFAKPNQPTQPKAELSEEFIAKVKELLPAQPWATGIHKIVAEKLDAPNLHVSLAIKELITQGHCYPQVDGIIFYPKDSTEEKENTSKKT